eukprot:CAMPEP_0196665998 /NCGR_PEP_ID=MMETSP1086-20130531/63427_1 /TAXON_ID=77921 /ORGANISM="Cyanoptyche  gloeocystis , Strain SAG4.97" /LENGTH=70 /DNA_ID=CAMNT_0042003031 /DNA_START=167 /DNA_END=375 /DNA_ORIENTATION=+
MAGRGLVEDRTLQLANVDSTAYTRKDVPVFDGVSINSAEHHWTNYFLCGYKGVLEHLGLSTVGIQVMVHG